MGSINEKKAVIFDLDGLLADTLPLHHKASQILWAEYKVRWTRKLAKNIVGMRIKEALQWQLDRTDLQIEIDQLVEKRESIYLNLLTKEVKPFAGAYEVLNMLKDTYVLAIASSSEEKAVRLVLNKLKITEYFHTIASGSQVKRSKPHPDIFLSAAKKMNVLPENCIVFEDAEHGIIAAKRAGMKAIAIPNKITRTDDFSQADIILHSLQEFKLAIIDSLYEIPQR